MKNWNGQQILVAQSKGGVPVALNPFDNLISTGITPWPPAEIIQKLYKSNHQKDFDNLNLETEKHNLPYYRRGRCSFHSKTQ